MREILNNYYSINPGAWISIGIVFLSVLTSLALNYNAPILNVTELGIEKYLSLFKSDVELRYCEENDYEVTKKLQSRIISVTRY